jgi:hypothetical protein
MTTQLEEPFKAKDKVQILLAEYSGLRNEIMVRTNNVFQLVAAAVLISLWIIARPVDVRFWIGLVLLVGICGIFWWFLHRDINKAAARLRQLEEQINRLAGEELMQWESRHGGAVTGYWGTAKPISGELPGSMKPSPQLSTNASSSASTLKE